MREKRPTPFCCDIKPKTHPFSLEQISNVCFLRRSEQKKGKSESEGRKGEVIRSRRILSLCNCISFVCDFFLSFFLLSFLTKIKKKTFARVFLSLPVLLHIIRKVRRGEKRWNPQAERGRLSFGVSFCRRGERGKKKKCRNTISILFWRANLRPSFLFGVALSISERLFSVLIAPRGGREAAAKIAMR